MYMPFYFYDDDLIGGVVSLILAWIPTTVFSIVTYVLTALAMYTIAKRRGAESALAVLGAGGELLGSWLAV